MPFHASTTQLRILGPGVAASVTRGFTNLFKGVSVIKIPSGGIKSIVNANKAANPKPTNAPRSFPTKTALTVGGVTASTIGFTQIIGDLTKPNPPGGTTGADIIKPVSESIGSFSDAAENATNFLQNNPGTILLLGGGVLLLLLIK